MEFFVESNNSPVEPTIFSFESNKFSDVSIWFSVDSKGFSFESNNFSDVSIIFSVDSIESIIFSLESCTIFFESNILSV